jgi:subtilisin family serine protease
MTTYNVALKEGVDYDAFWTEIETDGSGSTYVPQRGVDIVNARPTSLRQCWYDLTDTEAEKLRDDSRVYCVEIPPEFRTDIEIAPSASQTGLYYKSPGTNPANNLGINWGLFRLNSTTMNTTGSSGTLTYNYPLDGTGVDFVVQDSGCQVDHPEFTDAAGVTRVQQIDWYTASGIAGTMPANFYTDYDGHGTHCCGIAAGKTYGRAKNARIYVMTVSGLNVAPTNGISVTDVFDCIKGWHNNKTVDPALGYKRPTVVNMSWSYINTFSSINGGVYRGTPWVGSTKQAAYGMIGNASLQFGIRVDSVDVDVAELLAAGVVLVGAAGNYYQTLDVLGGPDYDNYFNQTSTPRYYMRGGSPASAVGVICVGNVSTIADTPEEKSGDSESGPRVDVWAPGTNIVSTTSTTNDFGATTAYPLNSNYKIMSISGTSMASPQVAGLAAQLLQVYPTATPAQIRQKIIDTSTANMLYTTGLSTDYSNDRSLHGGPNRFAYQAFNTASGGNVAGPVTTSNAGVST